jgi:hypothetical protein
MPADEGLVNTLHRSSPNSPGNVVAVLDIEAWGGGGTVVVRVAPPQPQVAGGWWMVLEGQSCLRRGEAKMGAVPAVDDGDEGGSRMVDDGAEEKQRHEREVDEHEGRTIALTGHG